MRAKGLSWITAAKVAGFGTLAAIALLTAVSPRATRAEPEEQFGYVGSRKCKKCHKKQYDSWEETKMAKAFAALAPGESAEAKTKAGLDPNKDYRTDEKCLGCHTTGFGKKGGYTKDYDHEKDKDRLTGVGCEMCHGPGEAFLGDGLKDQDYKDKATHDKRQPDLIKRGFHPKPEEKHCTLCHNKESPFFKDFEYEKRKDEGTHEHFESE